MNSDDTDTTLLDNLLKLSTDSWVDNIAHDENVTQRELNKKSQISAHKRQEKTKDCLHLIERVFIYSSAVAIFLLAAIALSHLILPVEWHYLTDSQITTIHTILSSLTASTIIAERFRKYFS